jgi:hypothetical protein
MAEVAPDAEVGFMVRRLQFVVDTVSDGERPEPLDGYVTGSPPFGVEAQAGSDVERQSGPAVVSVLGRLLSELEDRARTADVWASGWPMRS